MLLLLVRSKLRQLCSSEKIDQQGKSSLAPCEIAYLLRGGDVTHTLVVLAVDLLQRKLKNTQDDGSTLAPYEQNMWGVVTRSVKEWAMQKTQETVLKGAKTPIQISRRVFFLYNFVRKSLKTVISDTIQDPRKLKKYFAPSGLVRILADFSSAGYKQAFQSELRKDLLARGLLVPEDIRLRTGNYFFVAAAAGLALSLIPVFLVSALSITQAIISILASLAAAFFARLILGFRELLPLYQELALVAEKAQRSGWRFKLLKLILNSVNIIFWLALIVSILASIGIGFGLLLITGQNATLQSLLYILSLTITYFVIFDFAFEGWKLHIEETPTIEAEKQLAQLQKTFAQSSPLEAFRQVLSSDQYDATFSQLLALYGIETLLVLI
ncbi:MAG: hypothetical protein KIT34_02975 [Cyanobacteria bacterium TGS_CYA1]|nr:hypothetical protein [Cyanobacteria bacterium TGS_CYA1]